MKRLKVGAAGLALVLAVCSAFTNARNSNDAETLYGVTQEHANTYSVVDITGQTPNEDFRCNEGNTPCIVSADSSDVINGEVQKSAASEQEQGNFESLQ